MTLSNKMLITLLIPIFVFISACSFSQPRDMPQLTIEQVEQRRAEIEMQQQNSQARAYEAERRITEAQNVQWAAQLRKQQQISVWE